MEFEIVRCALIVSDCTSIAAKNVEKPAVSNTKKETITPKETRISPAPIPDKYFSFIYTIMECIP